MSYHRLDGGYENIALEMLTGKPALLIGVNPFPEAGGPRIVAKATLPMTGGLQFGSPGS